MNTLLFVQIPKVTGSDAAARTDGCKKKKKKKWCSQPEIHRRSAMVCYKLYFSYSSSPYLLAHSLSAALQERPRVRGLPVPPPLFHSYGSQVSSFFGLSFFSTEEAFQAMCETSRQTKKGSPACRYLSF